MLPIFEGTKQQRIEALNAVLRETFGLWVVQDAEGWHEVMSIDYRENVWQAFEDAFRYGVDMVSGFD
jgi:hypothetical protein